MTSGAIATEEYNFIRKLVYDRSRINLGPDKKELVHSRLQKRLRALGFTSFDAYCQLLEGDTGGDEITALLDVISTNFTNFFREWKHFEFLQEVALPRWEKLLSGKPTEALRIWSAACSSGEEPYSLAILLSHHFGRKPEAHPLHWEILGTDISTRVLSAARQAVYGADRLHLPDQAWLRSYFQKGIGRWEGTYRVKASLRSRVRFARQNLVDWPFRVDGPFQAIFCRNVMIYFDSQTQKQLLPQLIECLAPGGYLFIGHSESLIGIEHRLKCVQPSVYQRN